MIRKNLSEAPLELDYNKGTRTEKLSEAIKRHSEYIAHVVIQAFENGSIKDIVNTMQALYSKLGPKKPGIGVNSMRESVLAPFIRELKSLTELRKDTDEKGSYKAKNTRAPSKAKDEGEILYHLDMGTRHMDVLQDYEEVMTHRSELAQISKTIQALAGKIRDEIQRSSGGAPSTEPEPTPEK